MNLRTLRVLEIKKVYVDGLEEWIEIPVWEQDELVKLVNEIEWDGLDMRQYKKMLVEHWPGLSPSVKGKVKNAAARDELYEVLVHENWGLAPAVLGSQKTYYTDLERMAVHSWFMSGGDTGKKPDVL